MKFTFDHFLVHLYILLTLTFKKKHPSEPEKFLEFLT